MKGVSINDYVYSDPKDGIEGLCLFGVPKSGKSNMAHSIIYECLKYNEENLVLPGDMFCEFRNLILHKECYNEFILLVPENYDIFDHNIPAEIWDKRIPVDYAELDIEEHLKGKSKTILVIYDALFYKELLWRRVKLWNDIATQILFRTYSLDKPIILLFHEAGVFYPQISLKDHWRETYNFNQLNVDFRKGLVRLILISQLDKEILNTVRQKQYWVIYRKGNYSDSVPRPIRKRMPFYAVDQYCVSYGGIYTPNNRTAKLPEEKDQWKMIPVGDPEKYCEEHKLIISKKNRHELDRSEMIERMEEKGLKQKEIAYILKVSQQRVSQLTN